MSGSALAMALKRVVSLLESTQSTNRDHLPEKRDMILRTGHDSVHVNFFRFSCSGNAFIFNFTYFAVTVLLWRNLLYVKL